MKYWREQRLKFSIDHSNKSHNALVSYPTMHHSEQKCAHFCSEWCIVGYGTGAFWDWSIWVVHHPHTVVKSSDMIIIIGYSMWHISDKDKTWIKLWTCNQSLHSSPAQVSHQVFILCVVGIIDDAVKPHYKTVCNSTSITKRQINGLVQERRNSIANALELRLSCRNPSKCKIQVRFELTKHTP